MGTPSALDAGVVEVNHPIRIGLARIVGASVLLACMSGCAINPYIEVKRPDTGSVREAIQYANRVLGAYEQMSPDEFKRKQAIATGFTLLGAGVLGVAAGGHTHRDTFIGPGILGATTYQIANYNTSDSRLDIFAEARNSLVCGRSAVEPLDISQEQIREIRQGVSETTRVAGRASKAAGDVRRWLALTPASEPMATSAKEALAVYNERFVAANTLIAHASGAAKLVQGAGGALNSHVDRIRNAVDAALDKTQARVPTFAQTLQSLSTSMTVFAREVDSVKSQTQAITSNKAAASQVATAEDGCIDTASGKSVPCPVIQKDPVAHLGEAVGRLSSESDKLETQTKELSGLDLQSRELMQSALAACGVNVAKAVKPMRIEPAVIDVEAGKSEIQKARVLGGTSDIRYRPLSGAPAGADIAWEGRAITVLLTEKTVPGTYRLLVEDATEEAAQIFTLNIIAKPPKAPPPPAPRAPVSKKPGTVAAAPAPVAAPASACVAIPAGKVCAASDARCDFECGMSREQVSNMRAKLGLAATPASFSTEVREKLKALQKANGLQQTGDYDAQTAKIVDR